MRFSDIINEDKKKPEIKELTVDKNRVISDAEKIYDSADNLLLFLSRIHRPSNIKDRNMRFIYRVEEKDGNNNVIGRGEVSIKFNADKSKQPSDEFKQIINAIKNPKPTQWEQILKDKCEELNDANDQDFIENYFIPKVANPATIPSSERNATIEGMERRYETFGRAMVFYAGKCVSKLVDTDTKISKNNFQEIMQGAFGAAPDSNGESDSFLSQFRTLEPKMKIDAAKCTINSIMKNGETDNTENESYYSSMRELLPFLLEKEEDSNKNDFIEVPKKVSDFVLDDVNKALIQAKNVAQKYPKQYKIWYDKLQAAFQKGVKIEQDNERDPDKTEFENPITGKIEKRHGKAWGTGGPNGFIRDNKMLDKLCNDIKGQPWTIFNCGAKMILGIFDALETGGKIYQKICDDMGEGFNQVKHSIRTTRPKDFDKLIDEYSKNGKENYATAASMASVICGLTRLYQLLGEGKIGIINGKYKTVSTINENNTTVIQNAVNSLAEAIARYTKKDEDYNRWKEEKDKEFSSKVAAYENQIKKLEAEREGVKSESYQKTVRGFLLEDNDKKETSEKQSSIEKEIESQKKELEKLKNSKDKQIRLNLDTYFALLDGYGEAISHESQIADIYEFISKMFDADEAKEQYAKLVNGSNNEEEDSESMNDSFKIRIGGKLMTEADEYSADDDTDDKPEDAAEAKSEEQGESNNGKPGNLDWIKTGAGSKLINLYKIFSENPQKVRPDISMVKSMAKEKKQGDIQKKFTEITHNLSNTLQNIQINPITDGLIAFDYAFGENADESKLGTLAHAFKLEGFKSDNKDKKKEEKESDSMSADTLAEKRDELLKLIDNNSAIMKEVKSLNDFARSAENDSWLEKYSDRIKAAENYEKAIWDKCLEIYDGKDESTKKGHDWLLKKREATENQVYLNKLWLTLSTAKYIYLQIKDVGKKNESVFDDSNYTLLTESIIFEDSDNGNRKRHSVEMAMNIYNDNLAKIDFSKILDPDLGSAKYDIMKAEEFNNAEKHIAETNIGTKAGDSNLPKTVLKEIIGDPQDKDNKVYSTLKDCQKLMDYIVYGPKSKGLAGDDRDIYLLVGCMIGFCKSLKKFKGDDTDYRPQGINKSDMTDQGEQTTAGTESEACIPNYSKDSLINEIYKYIKG